MPAIENTVPWRMSTCTADGDASRNTMVGPRPPHTTSATVWPVRARQLGQQRRRDAHRVGLLQADQAELQRQRPERVAAAGAVLLDQADVAEAHQVRMGLGRRHAGVGGEVFQRHRAAMVGQCVQQAAADLDALDAARPPLMPVREFAIDELVCYSRMSLTDRGHTRRIRSTNASTQRFGDPP